jgi:prepilin-type N-terminal cleavage/methylation domain-containing protein
MRTLPSPRRPGWSLLELLIVLALLGFLAGLLLPAVLYARQQNERKLCEDRLKILGIAMHNLHDVYRKLPPVVGSFPVPQQAGSLYYVVLPYIEEDNLYRKALQNIQAGKVSVLDNDAFGAVVKNYLNPADKSAPPGNRYKGYATTGFAANALVFGVGRSRGSLIAAMPDGTSNTIMFAERYALCNGQPNLWGYNDVYYWAPMFAHYSLDRFQIRPDPNTKECDPRLAQTSFAAGLSVAVGDGSTRVLGPNFSARTWRLACVPNDGELMPAEWRNLE